MVLWFDCFIYFEYCGDQFYQPFHRPLDGKGKGGGDTQDVWIPAPAADRAIPAGIHADELSEHAAGFSAGHPVEATTPSTGDYFSAAVDKFCPVGDHRGAHRLARGMGHGIFFW